MISRKDFFFSYTDGNAQFRHVSSSRRSDSDGPKFFPSPDGNAQIHPTCPKVARQSAPHFPPSRHVGSDSDRPKFFSPSPDGNAQILPTCPKVARQPAPSPHFQPSRHVGSDSDGPKFVSHLMAMLRFFRRVLKSPVSRPPTSRRHVTSGRIPTGQNFFPHHLMAMLRFFRRVLKSPVSRPHPPISSRHVTSGRIPTGQNLSVT